MEIPISDLKEGQIDATLKYDIWHNVTLAISILEH